MALVCDPRGMHPDGAEQLTQAAGVRCLSETRIAKGSQSLLRRGQRRGARYVSSSTSAAARGRRGFDVASCWGASSSAMAHGKTGVYPKALHNARRLHARGMAAWVVTWE